MREGGVDRFVCLNIAVAPRTEAHVNDFAISLLSVPEAIPFGSVHPDSPRALDELRRLHERASAASNSTTNTGFLCGRQARFPSL